MKRFMLLLLAVLWPSDPAIAQSAVDRAPSPDSALAAVRARAHRLVATDSVPSLAIAAWVDGRLVWSEAFGWADRERRIPATTETVYGLGSLTKSITGSAILRLAESGRIDLDAPVNDYLGDAPVRVHVGDAAQLTVRRLLAMTGGVPHYVRNYWLDETLAPPSAAELVRRYAVSVSEPGSRYHYSNLAFGVAELLIERVTGDVYDEVVAQQLFEPIGMRASRIRRDADDASAARAYAHGDSAVAYWFTDPDGAAAGQASLDDLVRYARHHLLAPLPESPVRHGAPGDTSFAYAFGWGVLNVGDGHRVLLADGNVYGATSNLQIFPAERAFLLVVTNTSAGTDIVGSLAGAIGAAIAPQASARLTGLFDSGVWPPAPFRESPFTAAGAWSGRWQGSLHTPDGLVPVELIVSEGAATIGIGGTAHVAARDLILLDGNLDGAADLTIPTADTRAFPHHVRFSLRPTDGRLVGTVTAWADDARSHFVLPFFVELNRVP